MTTPNSTAPQADSPTAPRPGEPDPTSSDPGETPDSEDQDVTPDDDDPDDDQADDSDDNEHRLNAEARRFRLARNEARAERDEARTQLEALRQSVIDYLVDAAGYKPKLLAGRDPAEFFTDTGGIDHNALAQAVQDIAQELGVTRRGRPPRPNRQQATGNGQPRQSDAFTAAFASRPLP